MPHRRDRARKSLGEPGEPVPIEAADARCATRSGTRNIGLVFSETTSIVGRNSVGRDPAQHHAHAADDAEVLEAAEIGDGERP